MKVSFISKVPRKCILLWFFFFFYICCPPDLVDEKLPALGSQPATEIKPSPKPPDTLTCNCDEEENRERPKSTQLQPAEAEQIIEFEDAIQNYIYVR